MTHTRRPDRRYCSACAQWVPLSHMKTHIGGGEYVELTTCKACQCSSRIASARALGAIHQGGARG